MATAVLSSATPFPSLYCCSRRSPATIVLVPRNPRYHLSGSIPQLGLALISPWSGLKHLGISSRQNYGQKKKKEKWRGRVVYASLFGVGAPEALVIGVVALLVFGPKGLAEVARTLGKTLRAFQPTIREIQEVSRDFKSSLEREIGLDEVSSSSINTYRSTSFVNENQQGVVDPNGTATTKPYTSEELLKVTEDQVAASSIRPEKEAALNLDGQSQVPSEIAATSPEAPSSPTSPEGDVQLQPPSEKAEK